MHIYFSIRGLKTGKKHYQLCFVYYKIRALTYIYDLLVVDFVHDKIYLRKVLNLFLKIIEDPI